jgi:peptide/nickel transport system permease protein
MTAAVSTLDVPVIAAVDAVIPKKVKRPFGIPFWCASGWVVTVILSTTVVTLNHWKKEVDFLAGGDVASGNWTKTISWTHPFGVDGAGNDTLWELTTGAKNSLIIAFTTVLLGFLIGGALGMAAGYFRGRVDAVLSFFTTALLSLPPLLFIILLISVLSASAGSAEFGIEQGLQSSVMKVSLALAVLATPSLFRVVRASTIQYAQREFVTAARTMGAKPGRVLLREILPNVAKPLLAFGLVSAGGVMVIEGSLSFLGIGVGAGTGTSAWGKMIQEGASAQDLRTAPNIALIPAFVLFLTVVSLNFIGDKFRERLEVKQGNI